MTIRYISREDRWCENQVKEAIYAALTKQRRQFETVFNCFNKMQKMNNMCWHYFESINCLFVLSSAFTNKMEKKVKYCNFHPDKWLLCLDKWKVKVPPCTFHTTPRCVPQLCFSICCHGCSNNFLERCVSCDIWFFTVSLFYFFQVKVNSGLSHSSGQSA